MVELILCQLDELVLIGEVRVTVLDGGLLDNLDVNSLGKNPGDSPGDLAGDEIEGEEGGAGVDDGLLDDLGVVSPF